MAKRKSHVRRWCAVGSVFAAMSSLPPAVAGDNSLAPATRTVGARPVVTVAPGNWGAVAVGDIQVFLEAVAGEFISYAADPQQGPLRIRVVPRGGSPRVLYDRGREGEYVVQLTARNENWFQYAYQFSHELCHIVSHFDHKERQGDTVASGNQWFEEALCETAALYTLKRLATDWAAAPPARQWAGYGPVFASYAEFLQAQPHRRPGQRPAVDRWYREHAAALAADPYQREMNERLATALLPLFERDPGRWRAIAYLNADTASATKGFADFLGDWYLACPPEARDIVQQTMELFGFTPPSPAAPRLARANAAWPD
jgi:hypothetical protein